VNERGNVLDIRAARCAQRTVTVDAAVFEDMQNLLSDLMFDRAGGRQDDHAFLLRHCGRLSLIVAELLCPRAARDRDLNS
jgi:hypothetical protein